MSLLCPYAILVSMLNSDGKEMSKMSKTAKDGFIPVKSADRVLDIFEELLKQPNGLSTNELGQRLQIAGSSLHALIQTMLHRKYVKINEERKVVLGNKFYEFVGVYANDPLIVQSKPIMKALSKRVNENIHLAILEGTDIVFIACEQTTHPIRYFVEPGQTQKAHLTAVGKMLLSQYSDKRIQEMYANYPFEKITDNTIDSMDKLLEKLEFSRTRGYSLDDGEAYSGSKCYAGPIYDQSHRMIASLSISIPFLRVENDRDEEMISLVKEACRQLSSRLADG